MLGQLPGVHYTFHTLPAAASGANTAYEAVCPNPFHGVSAKVVSFDVIPVEDITGDATNSQNYNLDLVAGTEIGNIDFGAASNGTKGVVKTGTVSGTSAQCTIASGGSVLVEREEVGTQPVRAVGTVIRIGWRGAGV